MHSPDHRQHDAEVAQARQIVRHLTWVYVASGIYEAVVWALVLASPIALVVVLAGVLS
jgi:hypothetical protein